MREGTARAPGSRQAARVCPVCWGRLPVGSGSSMGRLGPGFGQQSGPVWEAVGTLSCVRRAGGRCGLCEELWTPSQMPGWYPPGSPWQAARQLKLDQAGASPEHL